eukprot:TRINITY_DN58047_c0_g1_i1.p1 TRINITY_DN58047_c0_g1~~TRINITY_DN58047_c0_g1_i1.p1  ORF type:complete len:156 (+),score=39.48 TRINITY_DN58047_c0_g1_i1:25-468(+)
MLALQSSRALEIRQMLRRLHKEGESDAVVVMSENTFLQALDTEPLQIKYAKRSASAEQLRPSCEKVLDLSGPSSLGSLGHVEGKCKPCIFQLRSMVEYGKGYCTKGIFCLRCHENHNEMPERKRKSGRQRRMQKVKLQQQEELLCPN